MKFKNEKRRVRQCKIPQRRIENMKYGTSLFTAAKVNVYFEFWMLDLEFFDVNILEQKINP
jgi:hypothetical protein